MANLRTISKPFHELPIEEQEKLISTSRANRLIVPKKVIRKLKSKSALKQLDNILLKLSPAQKALLKKTMGEKK